MSGNFYNFLKIFGIFEIIKAPSIMEYANLPMGRSPGRESRSSAASGPKNGQSDQNRNCAILA
jgi:hypothetical protein